MQRGIKRKSVFGHLYVIELFYVPNLENVLFSREFPLVVVVIRMRIMGARKNTNVNNFAMKNNKGNPHLIDMHAKRERIISTQRPKLKLRECEA